MGGAGGAGPWLDLKGSEFGDLWLGQVRVNQGKAPETPSMKHLLQVSQMKEEGGGGLTTRAEG